MTRPTWTPVIRTLTSLLLALTFLSGCSSPTEPERFVLDQSRWSGVFVTGGGQLITLRLTEGETGVLSGVATITTVEYAVTGRYEPPLVYLEMEGPLHTFQYVGQFESRDSMEGFISSTDELLDGLALRLSRRG